MKDGKDMFDSYMRYEMTSGKSSQSSPKRSSGSGWFKVIIGLLIVYSIFTLLGGLSSKPENSSYSYSTGKSSYTTTTRKTTTTKTTTYNKQTSKKKTTTKKSVNDNDTYYYDNPEDFYYDHNDDFFDYYDAEDYYYYNRY